MALLAGATQCPQPAVENKVICCSLVPSCWKDNPAVSRVKGQNNSGASSFTLWTLHTG